MIITKYLNLKINKIYLLEMRSNSQILIYHIQDFKLKIKNLLTLYSSILVGYWRGLFSLTCACVDTLTIPSSLTSDPCLHDNPQLLLPDDGLLTLSLLELQLPGLLPSFFFMLFVHSMYAAKNGSSSPLKATACLALLPVGWSGTGGRGRGTWMLCRLCTDCLRGMSTSVHGGGGSSIFVPSASDDGATLEMPGLFSHENGTLAGE